MPDRRQTIRRSRLRGRIDWPQVLLRACRLVETTDPAGEPGSLGRRLATLGVSLGELRRQFKRHLGTSPGNYANALRLMRLARGRGRQRNALESTLDAGFGSKTRGYAAAGASLGQPPGRLRRQPRIDYWMGLSELGWMLMGSTGKGICWLAFGQQPRRLLRELQDAFPDACCTPAPEQLRHWFEQVREHVLLPDEALRLPMDVRGTAFQAKVWQAVRRVPLGQTRSYAEIAQSVGRPAACRAVAAACAANRLAVIIPCHRVIASSGQPSGYRWGTQRKRRLLAAERRQHPPGQMTTSSAGSRRL